MISTRAPSRILTAGLGLTLVLIAGAPLSCAQRQTREQQQVSATEAIEDPITVLEARAELEALEPLSAPSAELLRRLVSDDTAPLTPGSEDYRKAMMESDAIESSLEFPVSDPEREPDATQLRHAMKLYTRARLLKQQGQAESAEEVLVRASELDPASAAIMVALGEVRATMNDAVGAGNAYERAVELGDRSATPLIYLASRAYSLGNNERVMGLCMLALEGGEIDPGSAPGALAGIMLGNAQIRLGYLRAGAESLTDALSEFDPSSPDPRWRRELVQIMGRRASLWIMAGDAWSKIGAHSRASDAYTQAASMSDGISAELTARRIAALLRKGRPAGAGLLLVDHISAHAADLTPLESDWVRTMSEVESLGTLLHDSIASIRREEGVTVSTRRMLMAIEVQGLSPQDALRRLIEAGDDAQSADAIVAAMRTLPSPEDQHRWAARLVAGNPGTAEAVAEAWSQLQMPLMRRLELMGSTDTSMELLRTTLALRMGRPDLLTHLDSIVGPALQERNTAWISAHAQASALTGRWSLARSLQAVLDTRALSGDRDAARRNAATLLIMQQPSEAQEASEALTRGNDAELPDLRLHARISTTLEDHEAARDALVRAWELDPYDTGIADRLIRLHGSGAPLEDDQALREIVRELSERRPRSTLFGLLRATELARNNLLREAERALTAINARSGADLVGDDLLLSIWKTQETQGQAGALDRGADWLRERLSQHPNSVRSALALAQIQLEREETEGADRTLEIAWNDTGSFDIARVREQLLRNEAGASEQANTLREQRLAGLRGVDPSIEYARHLAQYGDAERARSALDTLRQGIPGRAVLMPTQVRQTQQIVYELSQHAETEGIDEVMLGIISLIEDRTGSLDFFMARTEVLLKARADEVDVDALISLVDRRADQLNNDQNAQELRALPVQVLLGDDRANLAIAYMTRRALEGGEINETALIELFRLLGGVGENSDLLGVLDALENAGHLETAIELTTARIGTPERPMEGLSIDQQKADLAYTAGALAGAFQREEQSESYMQLALSFDPEHGWTNNDLGYALIERGVRIEEAERMLETAARVMPDQASVIDSLGWLRYKQGVFEDRVDEMTQTLIQRGAISLLSRANQLDRQRVNATILLHLGDAYWRAGQKENAIEAWLNGESMLRSRVRVLSAQPEQNRGAIEAASEELRTLRYRIQDAEAGGSPDIAPIFEDPGSN